MAARLDHEKRTNSPRPRHEERTNSPRPRLLAVCLGIVLLLSACGNGAGAGDEAADAATEDGAAAAEGGEVVDLRIGGGSPGSSVQVASSGIADMIDQQASLSRATVSSTDGAGANVRLTENGEVEMATSVTTSLWFSLNGITEFEGEEPYENWRMVFPGYTIPLYIVTTEGSGIESWRDLAGKRIAMGPRGSGVSQAWTSIFEELGLQADLQYIPYDEGNQRLQDGQVDAHMMGVNNFPAAIEAEAMLGDSIKWIGLTEEEDQQAAMEAFPPLTPLTLSSDIYDTLDEDIDTIGYLAVLIAHKDVPADVVYEVTELFVEGGEEFLASYGFWPEAFEYDLLPGFDVYEAMGAKVHDGYAQYWEDQGTEVPDAVRD